MGSIDNALPSRGNLPDSQNMTSDTAKIEKIILTTKYFPIYFANT
jgi:hypothetical protein